MTSGLTWACTLILETEVSLLKGTDPGQTGCHRHLVYLWKMINLTFHVFWTYLQPCGSMLIFSNFTNLCEFLRISRISTNFKKFACEFFQKKFPEIRKNSHDSYAYCIKIYEQCKSIWWILMRKVLSFCELLS